MYEYNADIYNIKVGYTQLALSFRAQKAIQQ